MVAEPWLIRIGSHVTSNLKSKKSSSSNQQTIGILSFEIANLISKTLRLHKSLTNSEISNLKSNILTSYALKHLVSSDQTHLLDLVLSEKLQDLTVIAETVSRLGNKSTLPHLQGFHHIFNDITTGAIDINHELGFLVKDMDAMARKMERLVKSTTALYGEMAVLNELETATKKFQQNNNNQYHAESVKVFEQKLTWQVQDVRHLKDVSLWNRSYDKIVEMLARTVCTLYARICFVFVDSVNKRHMFSNSSIIISSVKSVGLTKSDQIDVFSSSSSNNLSSVDKKIVKSQDFKISCGYGPGRLLMDCLSLNTSKLDDDDGCVTTSDNNNDRISQVSGPCSVSNNGKKEVVVKGNFVNSNYRTGLKSKSMMMTEAPPNTVGGSALALHYANVVIVIEKLLHYPHLVGEEARDDLYQMLPTSLRLGLKKSLKSYGKDLAIFDAPLAHDWKDRLDGILAWLAPLAHNMIHWQNERNFEQHHIVSRTNVLLLQTLYFADRVKTEAAICELLVGLNYICRYEHQQNALLDCASSFDMDDCTDWQLQY